MTFHGHNISSGPQHTGSQGRSPLMAGEGREPSPPQTAAPTQKVQLLLIKERWKMGERGKVGAHRYSDPQGSFLEGNSPSRATLRPGFLWPCRMHSYFHHRGCKQMAMASHVLCVLKRYPIPARAPPTSWRMTVIIWLVTHKCLTEQLLHATYHGWRQSILFCSLSHPISMLFSPINPMLLAPGASRPARHHDDEHWAAHQRLHWELHVSTCRKQQC